ncbi:potassium channel family protein [Thermococcus sp.]
MRRSKFLMIAIVVMLLAFVFSLFFMYFEKINFFDALYWAIITMATIGYGDVTPKSEGGKIVAMIAAVAGISTFTALISLLAESFISSSIRRMMGMHKVNFKMHYVIIGEGGSVSSCVDELKTAISLGQTANGEIVVLLPSEDEKKRLELPDDVEVLIGDPTNKETLYRAGIKNASHVILALEDDSKSVFVTLLVKNISKAQVFVEVLKDESVELLKQAGADRVIISRSLAGRLLASAVFEPEAVDVIEDLTTSSRGYDIAVVDLPEIWGMEYREAFERLYSRGLFLIGYSKDHIKLMPRLDEVIPKGARGIVIKGAASSEG